MKKIFIINGLPQSGKDTFCEYVGNYANVTVVSTVDYVRDILREAGWDGIKTPQVRYAMCEIKNMLDSLFDTSFKIIENEVSDFMADDEKEIMFIHCREPSGIQRFVSTLHAETIIVRRPHNKVELSNDADRYVEGYENYTYMLNNDGTLKDLDIKAQSFVKYLKGEQEDIWKSK